MNGLGCPFQVLGFHRDLVALLEAEVDGSVGQAAAAGLDRRGGHLTPSDTMRGLSGCGPYEDFIQDPDMSVGRVVETLECMDLK